MKPLKPSEWIGEKNKSNPMRNELFSCQTLGAVIVELLDYLHESGQIKMPSEVEDRPTQIFNCCGRPHGPEESMYAQFFTPKQIDEILSVVYRVAEEGSHIKLRLGSHEIRVERVDQ